MRFALSPKDPRLRDLVSALDRDEVPIAETWRAVGDAAWGLGFRRPGYHVVRRLAHADRARRAARGEVRRAAVDVLLSFASPYAVRIPQALDGLELARSRERLVLKQHKGSSRPP